MASSWILLGYDNSNISTSTTSYRPLSGETPSTAFGTTQALHSIGGSAIGGSFKHLYVNCSLFQPNPTTISLAENETPTDLILVFTGTGVLQNISDEVVVAGGEEFQYKIVTGTGGVASRLNRISCEFEATSAKGNKRAVTIATGSTQVSGGTFQSNNTTEWVCTFGIAGASQAGERPNAWVARNTFHAEQLYVTVPVNTRVVDSHAISRHNGADGNCLTIITAGVTGLFVDLSGGDVLQYGDSFAIAGRNFTGGGSMTWRCSGALFWNDKQVSIIGMGQANNTQNPNQTRWKNFGGACTTTLSGNSGPHQPPRRFTFGFFAVYNQSNTGTTDVSWRPHIDGADTGIVAFITPALGTGLRENISDTFKVKTTENFDGYVWTTATGGAIGFAQFTILLTEAPKFTIEPAVLNADPATGLPLGLGQSFCVQIGGAQTVPADPPVSGLTLTGLTPAIPQNAKIIPIPSGHLCLRGPAQTAVPVEIEVPVGGLVLDGLTPTLLVSVFAQPGTGALVLAGLAPNRFEESIRVPATGTLVLAGLTPSLDFALHPGLDALVLAGLTPTLFFEVAAQPASGTLVLAGVAPSLGFELHPGLDALILNGLAPTGDITVLRVPGVDALVFAGLAPSLDFELHPGLDALLLAGLAPQAFVQRIVAPPTGALVLAGLTPTRAVDDPTPVPVGALVLAGLNPTLDFVCPAPAGALVFAGQAPTATTGFLLVPGAGALVLAGLTPTRFVEERRFPATGTLVLAGLTPGLDFALHPGLDALVLAGLAPTRAVDDPTPVPSGALVLAGLAPSLAFVCPAPTGALVLAGLAPTVQVTVLRAIPAGALVFAGLTPTLQFDIKMQPGVGALVLGGLAPTLLTPVAIEVPTGALSLSGIAIQLDFGLHPGLDALVLAGLTPTLQFDIGRAPASGTLLLAGVTPSLGFTCPAPTGALVLAGLVPVIVEGVGTVTRAPGVGALVLSGQTPTLQFDIGRDPAAGALVLQGLVPTLDITAQAPFVFAVPVATLVLQGLVPLVQFNTVPTGTLLFEGHAPTRRTTESIAVPMFELRLDGHAPGIEGDLDIQIPIQTQLRFGGMTPVPDLGLGVPTGTLVLNGDAPTTGGVACPAPAALVFAGLQPVGATFFDIPAGSLVFAGLAPALTSPIICIDAAALVFSGTVNVEAGVAPTMPVGALVLAGHLPESVILSSTFDEPTTVTLRRLRQSPYIEQSAGVIFHERFQLNLQIGVGLGTGTAEENDPQITLDWSDTNARTWSNPYPVSAGPVGTSLNIRALWYRLGRSRNRIYRVTMTAPVKWALIDAYLQLKPGTN